MPSAPAILVVDDADDIRMLVRTVFTRVGWRVTETGRGAAVSDAIRRDHPDVVLLDVQMADQDGWQTLDNLRRSPDTADLPVVLCSVKGHPDDRERGWRLGCDGFVAKPFAIEDLVAEVTAATTRSPSERAAWQHVQLKRLSVREDSS